ncbi:VOC family protein [Bacillus hwajinpoensis]|uniref:VOC family protein n=1 Tax=Guptibacillus hwajinpoensis TaxID=208199 RepID=A0A845F2H3_9BACL|nr:VOC family protein [Pseudalkalibacillus hwajinpoensis]MYL65001.1 VOC family protein [Pseudalkalibacillus hwajinpoensis]
MKQSLLRIGSTYLPVMDVKRATEWYVSNLNAELSYLDQDKAILNMAHQSIFLVKAQEKECANFYDREGKEHFSLTFEVDGLRELEMLREEFLSKNMKVGELENRGHTGRNFVFYDLDGNMFDVWSEISSEFKERYLVPDPISEEPAN